MLTYNKGRARGEAVVKKCIALGAAEATLLHLDQSDNASIAALARTVRRRYARLDVLVNNAAVANWGPLMDEPVRAIERMVAPTWRGPSRYFARCCRWCGRL